MRGGDAVASRRALRDPPAVTDVGVHGHGLPAQTRVASFGGESAAAADRRDCAGAPVRRVSQVSGANARRLREQQTKTCPLADFDNRAKRPVNADND